MAEKAFPGVRQFKNEDIEKILEIEEQAFPKTPYPKETFLDYARIFPDNFVVVEIGEVIAGYIIFHMDGHILSTAIKPEYRRKGFGKMLFMYAVKAAERELWLEVRSKNGGAIEFYKRLGMEIVGKIPNYYGSDDALIMVLRQND